MKLWTTILLFSFGTSLFAQEGGVATVESEFLLSLDVSKLLANTKKPKWPEGFSHDSLDDLQWERQVVKDSRIRISFELHKFETKYRWSPDGEKCYVMGKFNEVPSFDYFTVTPVDTSLYRLDKIRASQAPIERVKKTALDYTLIGNAIGVKQDEAFSWKQEGCLDMYQRFLNKTVFEATKLAAEENCEVRILSIDETHFMQTMDIREDRLNFTVLYGLVIKVDRG